MCERRRRVTASRVWFCGGGALVLFAAAMSAVAQAAELRDPLRPPQGAEPQERLVERPRYVLQLTVVGADGRHAVINGRLVAVGERVDGALLLAVEAGRVRLRDAGGEFTVALAVPEVVVRRADGGPLPQEAGR